ARRRRAAPRTGCGGGVMDFDLTDEQRLLKESVGRLFAERYDFDARKRYAASAEGFSREMWSQYAALGLLGLPFAEAHGGFGGGSVGVMVVVVVLGEVPALQPCRGTGVVGGGLVNRAGRAAVQAPVVPHIADGGLLLDFAHNGRQARYNLADVATL